VVLQGGKTPDLSAGGGKTVVKQLSNKREINCFYGEIQG